ncbi:TadE/TadG family type IV pilus assembly protein [Methylophaga sp.]|jgi:Flp pilus assembly protein TadG|uniref:TadE/TadG family type IV pilus assembly protein n=1 Tax=Methylophaga sp. TaxID=2024840 RepID=UPI00140047F5|nr:TadE/TadG family type IV pilus assembly protein [Methylophaga sp.]MTI63504.1 pilus assembly protein [Methylophaga sp.]
MQRKATSAKLQKGAAAIEAALMFVIFFTLFYAIVSYSLPLLLVQAFNHAAASGARSAVAVEPDAFTDTDSYIQSGVIPRVRTVVGNTLGWLPDSASQAVLGDNNSQVQVNFDQATGVLGVSIVYPAYRESPMVPTLSLPGIGDIPRLPQDLRGSASVTL